MPIRNALSETLSGPAEYVMYLPRDTSLGVPKSALGEAIEDLQRWVRAGADTLYELHGGDLPPGTRRAILRQLSVRPEELESEE